VEFGDRYFEEEGTGRTFMHLPDREEILVDLAVTGWKHVDDMMRASLARESAAVTQFSDECRFWIAHRADAPLSRIPASPSTSASHAASAPDATPATPPPSPKPRARPPRSR
jgi:hypothetical protein